jgi:hypothetical protein
MTAQSALDLNILLAVAVAAVTVAAAAAAAAAAERLQKSGRVLHLICMTTGTQICP